MSNLPTASRSSLTLFSVAESIYHPLAEYSLKVRAFPNDAERARHLQALLREPNQIKGKKGAEREEPLFPGDVVKHVSGLGPITVGRWPRLDVSIKRDVVWMAGSHQMVSVVLSTSPASYEVQHRCLH